jgi:hypothetical protein
MAVISSPSLSTAGARRRASAPVKDRQEDSFQSPESGYTPWLPAKGHDRLVDMNIIILLLVLLIVFGGGGFFFGGAMLGGSLLGVILLIAAVVYFMGGFRRGA